MKKYIFTGVLTAVAFVGVDAHTAQAACKPISSVPTTITEPGRYCFTKNLTAPHTVPYVITVAASPVTIDMAGYTLRGVPDPKVPITFPAATRSVGIYGNNISNLVVTNGILKNFFYAIRLDSTTNSAVSNMAIDHSTFRGVVMKGGDNAVFKNRITNTGGTAVYPDGFSVPIEMVGARCTISYNTISENYPTRVGEAVGISLSGGNEGCVIAGNRLENTKDVEYGRTMGMWVVKETTGAKIYDNSVRGYRYALMGDVTATQMYRNIFDGSLCGRSIFPIVYENITNTSNQFVNEPSGACKETLAYLHEREVRNEALGTNLGETYFRLSAGYYDDFARTVDSYTRAKNAYEYMQKAADLGINEAKRLLPYRKTLWESVQ